MFCLQRNKKWAGQAETDKITYKNREKTAFFQCKSNQYDVYVAYNIKL